MLRTAIALAAALGAVWSPKASAGESDAAVRARLIRESISAYPGQCACPYSTMRNGRACGGRSAYSRGGGYVPLYYPQDIKPADLARERR